MSRLRPIDGLFPSPRPKACLARHGLIRASLHMFPDIVSRRMPNDGTPKEAIAETKDGTIARMPRRHVLVMTGDQWSEFIRLLTPDEQQAFMGDVWKLINCHCMRIGGD